MNRFLRRLLGATALACFVWLNVDYWRDPVYWRRWWDTMSHMDAEYLNLAPLDAVAAEPAPPLAAAAGDGLTVSESALRAAEAYAASFDSFAFIAVHRGVVQTEWYRPDRKPADLTQSQSMMKTVTALMIGAAIEDGLIGSLDDPIGNYFEEWQDDPRGRITIRNLLNMSSGLGKYEFSLNPFTQASAFRFLFSSERDPVVFGTPLEWEPGSKFDYNDANAQLAGMLVQRVLDEPYATYLSRRLWGPVAGETGYVWMDRSGGNAMTACCMVAPAMAWARIGVMLKDGGRYAGRQVVAEQWIEELIRPSAVADRYGLFTWLAGGLNKFAVGETTMDYGMTEPFDDPQAFMLLGLGGQRVYVSRALDLVIVRMGPFSGYQPLKPGWDNSRLFNLIARGIKKVPGTYPDTNLAPL
ncbi:MAG: serine hydrolase [Gammaproteobacteria bacterium]|nr:serine hydrolase [Gammaproteobacteria bacterium]